MTDDAVLAQTGGNSVTIFSIGVKERWNKNLLVITIPNTAGGTLNTKYKDLLRAERVFTITGKVQGNSDLNTLRTILLANAGTSAQITFKYSVDGSGSDTTFNVGIRQATIDESPQDSPAVGDVVYDVILEMIVAQVF